MAVEADYYPLGAYEDPNAPYNQDDRDPDYIKKDVEICISLSKTVTIETNNYVIQEDEEWDTDIDENGNKIVVGGKFSYEDFSDTDWKKAYSEDECNILTLLKEYGRYLKQDINIYKDRLKESEELQKDYPDNRKVKKDINMLKNKIKLLERKYEACNGYIIDDLEVFEA